MTPADEASTRRDKPDGATKSTKAHRRRRLFFAVWGALVLGTLIVFRGVLLPFFLAIIVAYVLTPVVSGLERAELRGRRLPRWLAVVLVYAGLLGVLGLLVVIGAPRLGAEVQKLARDLPAAVTEARDEWLPQLEATIRGSMAAYDRDELPEPDLAAAAPGPRGTEGIRIVPLGDGGAEGFEVRLPPGGLVLTPDGDRYAITHGAAIEPAQRDITTTLMESVRGLTKNTEHKAAAVLRTAQTLVRAVARGIFTFFIMWMLSAYLILTREGVIGFLRSLVWSCERESFDRLLSRIDRGLSGVVRGQLLICLLNGILSGIGFYLLDLRYWPILTLVATLFSIIPIFGAILSSVPAVVIGLEGGLGTGLAVLAWILVVHQIEANLLNPKIMGDAAHVHPVLVVFALLAGEHLFGIAGALLAVPVLSIAQSLFLHYREAVFGEVPVPQAATGEPTTDVVVPPPASPADRATA